MYAYLLRRNASKLKIGVEAAGLISAAAAANALFFLGFLAS